MDKFYTCEQVAERYGVKIETVWAWIREQKLTAIQTGKFYRISESDLKTFVQNNRTDKETTDTEN